MGERDEEGNEGVDVEEGEVIEVLVVEEDCLDGVEVLEWDFLGAIAIFANVENCAKARTKQTLP